MKKVLLCACITSAVLFSCNRKPAPVASTPQTPETKRMDSLFAKMVHSVDGFVGTAPDTSGSEFKDIRWISNDTADGTFTRIRVCEVFDSTIIIEQRPSNGDYEMKCSALYKDSNLVYVFERSHFKGIEKIKEDRRHIKTFEELSLYADTIRRRLNQKRFAARLSQKKDAEQMALINEEEEDE